MLKCCFQTLGEGKTINRERYAYIYIESEERERAREREIRGKVLKCARCKLFGSTWRRTNN